MDAFPELKSRRASGGDLASIETLRRQCLLEIEQSRGGKRYADLIGMSQGVESEAADPWEFVVLLDDVVVGYAQVALQKYGVGCVLELYVEPDAREVGAGQVLLDEVRQRAQEAGLSDLDVNALPGSRSLKNLLERNGFKTRLLVLSVHLD